MKTLTFFNSKGGVGKTTLTFNVAHMMARLGCRVVAADLHSQCTLTWAMLPDEDRLALWERSQDPGRTAASCVDPVRRGVGELGRPTLLPVTTPDRSTATLWLLPNDPGLSRYDEALEEGWARVAGGDGRAVSLVTSVERLLRMAAESARADVVIVDLGPGLSALNHTALIACDAVVVPIAPDLLDLHSLRHVGPSLRAWREGWLALVERLRALHPNLPVHEMAALGYVDQQFLTHFERPMARYRDGLEEVRVAFHEHVLGTPPSEVPDAEGDDAHLASLKRFSSLVEISALARKPVFDLRAAEGIGGTQFQSVAKARVEFERLSRKILGRLGVAIPDGPVGR